MSASGLSCEEFKRHIVEHPRFEKILQHAIIKYKINLGGQRVEDFACDVRSRIWISCRRSDLSISTVIVNNAVWEIIERKKKFVSELKFLGVKQHRVDLLQSDEHGRARETIIDLIDSDDLSDLERKTLLCAADGLVGRDAASQIGIPPRIQQYWFASAKRKLKEAYCGR